MTRYLVFSPLAAEVKFATIALKKLAGLEVVSILNLFVERVSVGCQTYLGTQEMGEKQQILHFQKKFF